MTKFTIHVIETIFYTVDVEAENSEAACTAAEQLIIDAADRFERYDGQVAERRCELAETPEDWT